MFGNASYLLYLLLFSTPVIGYVWARHHRLLIANIRVIGATVLCGVALGVIGDPVAGYWEAWSFSSDKILGIWILNAPFEDVLFAVIVCFTISIVTIVFLDWRQRGKRRWLVG